MHPVEYYSGTKDEGEMGYNMDEPQKHSGK